jgi:UDP-glucose:(heptosyl)LPS alpha-1,3-glucosyltransferase
VHSHENCWHGQVQTVHVLPTTFKLFHDGRGSRAVRWLKAATSPRRLTYLLLERARFAPRRDRRIVATSITLRRQMAAAFPKSASLLHVIAPGVTMPASAAAADGDGGGLAAALIDAGTGTTATPQQRLEARHRLGLPAAGKCVLFVGHDFGKKGLPALLEALSQLPADTWLAVVGGADHIAHYRDGAAVAGVGGRVHFLGALKNIHDAYAAADCLAHPTLEDTFAMVVIEAMSHGLPVVVSGEKHCGISSMLAHGDNALLLDDPRDAAALAAALRRVLDDAPVRRSLAAAAVRFAAAHQWTEIARQQEAIYFSINS